MTVRASFNESLTTSGFVMGVLSPPGSLLLSQQQTIDQQEHQSPVEQEEEGFHG